MNKKSIIVSILILAVMAVGIYSMVNQPTPANPPDDTTISNSRARPPLEGIDE